MNLLKQNPGEKDDDEQRWNSLTLLLTFFGIPHNTTSFDQSKNLHYTFPNPKVVQSPWNVLKLDRTTFS